MKTFANYIILSLFFLGGCAVKNKLTSKKPSPTFVKGADINWLPQMEASGYKFYNHQGVEEDCFKILKDHGINTIRLRTFVNPSQHPINGHCSQDETVAMAVRAQKWGMRVMLNFHYSDSWADPGKQKKTAAWEGHDFASLNARQINSLKLPNSRNLRLL